MPIVSRELENKIQEFISVCEGTKRDPIIELNRAIEYINSNNKEIEYIDAISISQITSVLANWINNNQKNIANRLMDIIDLLERTDCRIVSRMGKQVSAHVMKETQGDIVGIIKLPRRYREQIMFLIKEYNLDPLIFRLIVVGEFEGHDMLQEAQDEAYKYMASAKRDKDGDIIYDYV